MDIFYLCDRKACTSCRYPECKHTTDIAHAEYFFVNGNGNFIEKEELQAERVDTPIDTLYTRYKE